MENIVEIARTYIGKKEKSGNSGFEDKQMEKDMRAVGWSPGWAWCAGVLELWAWKAYPEIKDQIKGLFVPSATQTYKNLVKAGYKHSMEPTVGSFMFMQKVEDGKKVWMGHCGVVSEVINPTTFKSIEGNTNSAGSREGDSVQEKTRTIKKVQNGLEVIGFITLP